MLLDEEEVRKARRSVWVREALTRRGEHGGFATWFAEEKLNAGNFHSAFRMTPTRFEEILGIVGLLLQRQTNY